MKKLFLILAAAAVTMWSCQKPAVTPTDEGGKQGGEEQNPDPKPEVKDEITLISDAVVNLPTKDSQQFTVKFTTNAAWTAEADEFITLQKTSGEAGENIEVMAVVQSLGDEKPGRVGGILIKAGKAEASVGIMQGQVFIVDPQESEIGIEGGKVEFQVISNQEYTVKTYDAADAAFPWAPVTFDQKTGMGSLAVEPNGGYDARTAYIKFTVPGIQVPALDDEGNPTGETEDYVTRFYVYQAGNSKEEWRTYLTEAFNVGEGATASVALFDGKLLVSDSQTVHIVDPATGKFTGTLNTGELPVQSITNDDAGNLLLANLGVQDALYDVYVVKASDTKLSAPIHLIHFVNDAWSGSTGIDKVAARGDVTGNGIVTAMYGGVISYGGLSYTLYWSIKDGKAAESYYNEWNPVVNNPDKGWEFTTPQLTDDLWVSNRAAFVAAGPSASDGFFYGGYDGLYNVYYHNGTDWQVCVEGAGNWGGGPQGLHATTWNGKKILVVAQMGYVWWSEGWGMPAYLWVVDVTDPAAPEVISHAEYTSLDQVISGDTENSSVDVLPVVDGNDLVVYYVDSSHGQLIKVRFPKL